MNREFKKNSYFNWNILNQDMVCPTLTTRAYDCIYENRKLSTKERINISTFPQDYKGGKYRMIFLTGMSVPPVMIANIAKEVQKQIFKIF